MVLPGGVGVEPITYRTLSDHCTTETVPKNLIDSSTMKYNEQSLIRAFRYDSYSFTPAVRLQQLVTRTMYIHLSIIVSIILYLSYNPLYTISSQFKLTDLTDLIGLLFTLVMSKNKIKIDIHLIDVTVHSMAILINFPRKAIMLINNQYLSTVGLRWHLNT